MEEEELFEVDFFLNTRIKDGKRHYKVRWKGYPPEEDTWEPEENVIECEEVLNAFWEKRRKNANRKQKKRRYRILSEEEEAASTSRENKSAGTLGDIEPLGLTRQASKELAMCLNKSQSTRRESDSSTNTGSDVTLVENDVFRQMSSKSTLLSFQTESDVIPLENDIGTKTSSQSTLLSSQTGSDVISPHDFFIQSHSSHSGSDALSMSTENTNDFVSSNDVIDISSQESSPGDAFVTGKAPNNKKPKVEVISLLSDSEDNADTSGSQPSETQSPIVYKSPRDSVSRDLSPVIPRASFQLPSSNESTPSSLCGFIENSGLEKVTDQTFDNSLKHGLRQAMDNLETTDVFDTPVRRKNRFELSLKKRRRRSLNDNEVSQPSSEVGEDCSKIHQSISDVNLSRIREGKTPLQKLKESMTRLEDSTPEKMDFRASKIADQSETKMSGNMEKKSNKNPISVDVCPTITELKGLMYEIAKKDRDLGAENFKATNLDSLHRSETPDDTKTENDKDISSGINDRIAGRKTSLETTEVQKKEPRSLCSFDKSNNESSLDADASLGSSGHVSSDEVSMVTTMGFSSGESKCAVLESDKNLTLSLRETETKHTGLKDDEEKTTNEMAKVMNELKSDTLKRKELEEGELTQEEMSGEKEENEEKQNHESLPTVLSSSTKVVALTSESTTRVLKNLRSLVTAKSRDSKNNETGKLAATEKEMEPDKNASTDRIESNWRDPTADNGNSNPSYDEESPGNNGILNDIGNKSERELSESALDEIGNKKEQINENNSKKNNESELVDLSTKPSYSQSVNIVDNAFESKDENVDKATKETDSDRHVGTEENTVNKIVVDEKREPAVQGSTFDIPSTAEAASSGYNLPMSEMDSFTSIEEETPNALTVCGKQDNQGSNNVGISIEIPSTKNPYSSTTDEQFDIHNTVDGAVSSGGCHGNENMEEFVDQDFKKHGVGDTDPIDDKVQRKKDKIRKGLKKSREKKAPVIVFKRKKIVTNNLESENSNFGHDGQRENRLATAAKMNSKHPKVLKQKKNEQVKLSKTTKTGTEKKTDTISQAISTEVTPLVTTKEESAKKNFIIDANFSSSLTTVDLIGSIIDEGNRENTFEESKKRKSSVDGKNSKDLLWEREEEDMMVNEEEENFDFELEDFPLEKLLQEEDDNNFRYIPSPPVEPLDVPFASVKTAIRDGDEMTVRAALAGGLELDTLDGASGMTLLMIAAASGQEGVVELLLRRKAEVDACQKNGMTALMHACEQGYPETAHVLLLCNADINKQQIAGETALMKACKKGQTDVVEVLLRNGADTRLESKSGHTAQQFANRTYPELASLIEEHEKRLSRVVEEAILQCLGDTVSLCKPAILPFRCVLPREGQQMTFPFQFFPQIYEKDVDVIVFCIKAVFDDVVSLLFGEDNGIRGVLLNNKPQIPLLHGIRSIFSIDPKPRLNTITLQTHKCSNPASKIITCIYAVQSKV